jgi:hypothetical protein
MTSEKVGRDERTIAIENKSFKFAYLFLCFALLALVAFRSFTLHQQSWDLMAAVVLSGGAAALLRRRQFAFTISDARSSTVAVIGGLVVAVVIAYASRTVSAVSAGYHAAGHGVDSSR